jgi:prepilin-type N-terminal cleavage/methylation domain-containing protein
MSLMSKRSPSKNGFTIIETMIALSIVGLIMVIVFIAVPEMQSSVRDKGYGIENLWQ